MVRITVSLGVVIMTLVSVSNCFSQNIDTRPSATNERVLNAYRQMAGISEELFSVLKDWNAVPTWAVEQPNRRMDWLKTLHENVTRHAWPEKLKDAVAGTVAGRSQMLAFSTRGTHRAIGIFDSTPAYLSQLAEVINHPLVLPGSPDPHAAMKFDPARGAEAVHRLGQMLGMLKETSYLDGPNTVWRPAVIFGTRFIYYHELGHLALQLDNDFPWKFDLHPVEREFSEELYVDRFAFVMLTLENRSRADLQVTAMAGVAFAMSLIASQEFVNEKAFGSIKGAVLRMGRILHWARLAVNMEELSPKALTVTEYYWRLFKTILQQIDNVPSPVFSLLRQTADRPQRDWDFARNQIVKWCAFGECSKVATTFNEVCRSAKDQIDKEAARKTLQIIYYILKAVQPIERSLGFTKHFQDDVCNSTLP